MWTGTPVGRAAAAANLGGEQAGMVVVQVRRQHALRKRVDPGREALRDVVVAEPLADHAGVLALDEGVVTGHQMQTRGNCRDSHPLSLR